MTRKTYPNLLLTMLLAMIVMATLWYGFCGCIAPKPPTPPPTAAPDMHIGARLIIVTKGGEDFWTDAMILNRTRHLKAVGQQIGIEWTRVDIERLERPEWFDITEASGAALRADAEVRTRATKQHVFHLVETIEWSGHSAGGLAWMPPMYGCLIATNSYDNVMLHEWGHSFGLAHSWVDDGCDDTPLTSQTAYCSAVACPDCMSYCRPADPNGPCFGRILTACQTQTARGWCLTAPRSSIVQYDGTPPKIAPRLRLSTSTDPIVCDQ